MHLKAVTLNPGVYPTTDHYPFNLSLFQQRQRITFESPVTFFVGENGSGKSTLLEAITRKCGIHNTTQYQVYKDFMDNPSKYLK